MLRRGRQGQNRRASPLTIQDSIPRDSIPWGRFAVRIQRVPGFPHGLLAGVEQSVGRGFWHMGQFARDYQRHFGELPSQSVEHHQVAVTVNNGPC